MFEVPVVTIATSIVSCCRTIQIGISGTSAYPNYAGNWLLNGCSTMETNLNKIFNPMRYGTQKLRHSQRNRCVITIISHPFINFSSYESFLI